MSKRKPLPPPEKPLGKPARSFDDTFSAQDLIMDHFFPAKPQPISGAEYFKAKREEIMKRFAKTLSYLAKH